LVTGASGSLGGAVVRRLLAQGQRVRVLVRRAPARVFRGVEVVVGNLGDPDAVERAVCGATLVVHAGAAMKGDLTEHQCATVVGTQNIADACARHGVSKLVHISSMSVVDWAGSSGGAPVSETTALEPRAAERGAYTQAKLRAENVVRDAARAGSVAAVILRPGQIFGGGVALVTGAVARRAGKRWLVLGDGELVLPLVYIEDVVDAILLASQKPLVRGEIIQLIDPEVWTQNQVLAAMGAGRGTPVIRVPRRAVFAAARLSEVVMGTVGKSSPVAEYRMRSAMAMLRFAGQNARALLGWQPRVGVRGGIARELAERPPERPLR
jgi:nucleoside-diphosphate-sugar epimerase